MAQTLGLLRVPVVQSVRGVESRSGAKSSGNSLPFLSLSFLVCKVNSCYSLLPQMTVEWTDMVPAG